MSWTLFFSLVKRLEFGPAPPRGISHGAQSPQGGVKILLWEGRGKNPSFLSPSWPSSYDIPGLWAELSSLSPYVLLIVLAPCPHWAKREAPPINARTSALSGLYHTISQEAALHPVDPTIRSISSTISLMLWWLTSLKKKQKTHDGPSVFSVVGSSTAGLCKHFCSYITNLVH